MEIIQKLGLPVSKPIVKVEQSGIHMIVMERVKGLRWVNNDIENKKLNSLTPVDWERTKFDLEKVVKVTGLISTDSQ